MLKSYKKLKFGLLVGFQQEHMDIIASRAGTSTLTWAEVNNMPYTLKVVFGNFKNI